MEARPDSVWDGLSTSKQEFFKSKHIGGLDFTLMLGVSYAFDIHAGVTKEAPRGMKRATLKWFHCLSQEPGRLWKRYHINKPKSVSNIAKQLLRRGISPTQAGEMEWVGQV
jgi:N-acetylglucosaminyldiphosphoundecaprenol N-acetyl-beta-D-mannosaminyltransferase